MFEFECPGGSAGWNDDDKPVSCETPLVRVPFFSSTFYHVVALLSSAHEDGMRNERLAPSEPISCFISTSNLLLLKAYVNFAKYSVSLSLHAAYHSLSLLA